MPSTKFGPRRLSELRDEMVAAGNCRRYVNAQVRELIAIFRYGVGRELVKPETLVALQSLEPLRASHTTAKESRRVFPVELEHVRQTAPHLSPPVRS